MIEENDNKPKTCIAQNTAGKYCEIQCNPGCEYCAEKHDEFNQVPNDQKHNIGRCIWCKRTKLLIANKNICPICLPKQQVKNRNESAKRIATNNYCSAKTLDKSNNVIQCPFKMNDNRFCNRHNNMIGGYSDEEIEQMQVKKCSGCHNGNYCETGQARCLNCTKRTKKSEKKNINFCETCEKEGKNINGKNKIGDKYYCGNHVKTAQTLLTGTKCSKSNCPNPCAKGHSRCQICIDNGRNVDKKRQENKSKHNTMIEKQYEDDEIDVLDNENADGYGQYSKIGLSIAKKNTLSLCQENGCGIYFTPFLNTKQMLSIRCRGCLHKQREIEAVRSDRDRKEAYKEYEKRPERQEEKKNWRKDNPEKMKLYDYRYKFNKLSSNPDEYYEYCKNMSQKWRHDNPQKMKERYENDKKDPNKKLKYYKRRAKNSNYDFSISDEHAIQLFQNKKCVYCGIERREYLHGIDRINNSLGYIEGNVVTCCQFCNEMKGSLDKDQFLSCCEHIVTYAKLYDGLLNPLLFPNYPKQAISSYKHSAKERGIDFNLTLSEFNKIKSNECYICGKMNTEKHYNGIDRIDSTKKYTDDNCNACCGTCNFMKLDYPLEFLHLKCLAITNLKHQKNDNNSDDDKIDISESEIMSDDDNEQCNRKTCIDRSDLTNYNRDYYYVRKSKISDELRREKEREKKRKQRAKKKLKKKHNV